MLVYLNFTERQGPYGGANSFLRALTAELGRHGAAFTTDPLAPADVALVNALTEGMNLERVRALAERGVPIVHRKTGFRGRGSPDLRTEVDGVVVGDRLQIEFTPYVRHTIFQSHYSRDVFVASGFEGPHSVISNGVDETQFNTTVMHRWRRPTPRTYWSRGTPVRVVISTWSTDDSKGFPAYRAVDSAAAGRRDLRVTLVGRVPHGTRFRAIHTARARPPRELAALLKRQHVVLQLTEHESCSNALIEGINCGLPAVYLDSGANAEVAENYGVRWAGALDEALERLLPAYEELVARARDNPYRITNVAPRYLTVLQAVADGRPVEEPSVAGVGFRSDPVRRS